MSNASIHTVDSLAPRAVTRERGLLLTLVLAVFLGTLPLGWLQVASVSDFAIRPMHLSLIALALASLPHLLMSGHGSWRRIWSSEFNLFCFFYVCYFAALGLSLVANQVTSTGMNALVKYGTYFLAFALLYTALQAPEIKPSTVARAIYLGCPLGLLLFLGIATFIFYRLGRNLPQELMLAVVRGDTYHLRWGIYAPLFNEPLLARADSEFVRISLRNTLMGSFLLFIVLVWTYRKSIPPTRMAFVGRWGVTIVAGLLILTSLSRSNIAAAGLVCVCSFALNLILRSDRRTLSNAATVFAILGVFVATGLFAVSATSGIDEIYRDRMGFTTLASDPRIEMFRNATRDIGNRPLFGHGIGSEIQGQFGGSRVHNLFLAAWYEAGVLAFCGAVLFWGHILIVWIVNLRNVLRLPHYWQSSTALPWVMTLPVLPLLRSLLSGEGGNFTLIEWCCLAFYFAMLAENHREHALPR